MRTMKLVSILLLILCFCLLSGCKVKVSNQRQEPIGQESNSLPQNSEEILEEEEGITIKKISSIEIIEDMRTGWNLGNTLDAQGGADLSSEIAWGCPFTTKEMIQDVIDAGFNVIRIPVTWDQHIRKDENYQIDLEWMTRVKEVVDYAYLQGAYVILNTHHEEQWLYPSKERKDESIQVLIAVWKQIAETFKEYDEHLLFEGVNEPRLVGTQDEWNGGNQEAWDIVNQFNQVFVDTIRESGGNNKYRHLLITDYAGSSNVYALTALTIPNDPRIIVTVHCYAPYPMALEDSLVSVFDPGNPDDTEEIDHLMSNLKALFIDQGIPVLISEYGARDKNNRKDRVAVTKYLITAAEKQGIPCIWWDNGAFDKDYENFGLYDRVHRTWPYPEILDTIMENTK